MKMSVSEDGIGNWLNGMLNRASLVSGWLNRVAYPEMIKIQRVRWQTEGASQGAQWKPLKSENYRKYKLRKFADYPGAGSKLLIATNRLVDSMTGDNKNEHWKMVDVAKNRLEVGSFVPYGGYVDDERDITGLSDQAVDGLISELLDYLNDGVMKAT